MQVTIEIPQNIVDMYVEEYYDVHERMPSQAELQQFFDQDVRQIYCEVAENEGFIDSING
jgi:hypothetical protein